MRQCTTFALASVVERWFVGNQTKGEEPSLTKTFLLIEMLIKHLIQNTKILINRRRRRILRSMLKDRLTDRHTHIRMNVYPLHKCLFFTQISKSKKYSLCSIKAWLLALSASHASKKVIIHRKQLSDLKQNKTLNGFRGK